MLTWLESIEGGVNRRLL